MKNNISYYIIIIMNILLNEEYFFFIILFLISLMLGTIVFKTIYILCIGVILLAILFFIYRIPERNVKTNKKEILAPVDGFLYEIVETNDNYRFIFWIDELDTQVHWAPVTGKITSIEEEGETINVNWLNNNLHNLEKNKRIVSKINSDYGEITFIQTKSFLTFDHNLFYSKTNTIEKGSTFGYMMFPGRIDLILPKNININVHMNEKVIGGKTVICEFH